MKTKARELAIPVSDAFWYIRTLATELVHELGELGPLGVKSSQLVWSQGAAQPGSRSAPECRERAA